MDEHRRQNQQGHHDHTHHRNRLLEGRGFSQRPHADVMVQPVDLRNVSLQIVEKGLHRQALGILGRVQRQFPVGQKNRHHQQQGGQQEQRRRQQIAPPMRPHLLSWHTRSQDLFDVLGHNR
jgi:hypothetical protein